MIAHAGSRTKTHWNGGGKAASWWSGPARHDLGGQQHPTQKPLGLMRQLVDDFTEPGELVLDPFAGAGSTAVACKELGRRFVGWELSPFYHAVALERLALVVDAPQASPGSAEASRGRYGYGALAVTRRCAHCGESLPPGARADARYHRQCRQAAYRERRRVA